MKRAVIVQWTSRYSLFVDRTVQICMVRKRGKWRRVLYSVEKVVCASLILFALCFAIEEPRQEIEVDVENTVGMNAMNHGKERRRSSGRVHPRIEEDSGRNEGEYSRVEGAQGGVCHEAGRTGTA